MGSSVQEWIDDGSTWKRPVRKKHAKLRRLWDVLPPAAKKKDVLCSSATLPGLLFTRVHKTGIDGQIKEGYSLPLKGC